MFDKDLFGDTVEPEAHKSLLGTQWGYPPTTLFNAREGWWQERKRQWLAMGIKSEVGRAGALLYEGKEITERGLNHYRDKKKDKAAQAYSNIHGWAAKARSKDGEMPEGAEDMGTSIFDPVVCELCYKWFCPPGGVVIDPFAGGSVRGVVASVLGREYHGVELRHEQVAANQAQHDICVDPLPCWYEGDSTDIESIVPAYGDFVFSCPPYFDLEVYSDDKRDLSAMDYPGFVAGYRAIIAASCRMLRNHSFACFVVGEVRDKKTGAYRNFVGDTVQAFLDAGLSYHNEIILLTMMGSLPVRSSKPFAATRKLGKTHQNVLVFCKGDPRKASAKQEAIKEAGNGQGHSE